MFLLVTILLMMLKYLQDKLIEISRSNGISNLYDSLTLLFTTFLTFIKCSDLQPFVGKLTCPN